MLWKQIEKQLIHQKLSVYRLALKAGIDPAMVYRLRDGKAKDLYHGTVVKIADALGVSLDEFR